MGCLRRIVVQIGCGVVLLALLVLGFIYREQVTATYRRLRGLPPPPDSTAYVAPSRAGEGDVRRGLARLAERNGPAYVDFTAGDLAGLISGLLTRAGGDNVVDSIGVALAQDEIRVQGVLDLSKLPRNALGPFAGTGDRRQPVTMAGTMRADSGRVWWTVTGLTVGGFPFPRGTIGPLLRALHVPGAVGAAIPLPLEGSAIGDVQVRPGSVRVYRSRP